MRICLVLAIVFLLSTAAFAEDFHFEFTAGYWPLNASGNVVTNSTFVDLVSDLGVRGRKSHGDFKLAMKPVPKHSINIQFIPYRLRGSNTVSRAFQLGGRTYFFQDQVRSKVNVDFLLGEYQYDIVDNSSGHAGITVGVAYFGGKATVNAQRAGTMGTEQGKAPLPLVGGEFRIFPIPQSELFNVNGEVKGMSLGSYGHYIQMNVNAGVALARSVRLQIGYSRVDFDVHNKSGAKGFKLHMDGPIFSVQLHD